MTLHAYLTNTKSTTLKATWWVFYALDKNFGISEVVINTTDNINFIYYLTKIQIMCDDNIMIV